MTGRTIVVGKLSVNEFRRLGRKHVLYLIVVGGASWICCFLELASWLAFRELQAKSASEK